MEHTEMVKCEACSGLGRVIPNVRYSSVKWATSSRMYVCPRCGGKGMVSVDWFNPPWLTESEEDSPNAK